MITQKDKEYLTGLKTTHPEIHNFIQHLLDDYRQDTLLGCHDISNIISLIYGNFQLMELTTSGLTDNPRWTQMSEDIHFLVNSMEAVSYYRYSHLIKREVMSLDAFVNEYLVPLIDSTKYHHLHIHTNICNEQVTINIDPNKLTFVIKAIIDNISEYDCDANVQVSLYSEQEKLIISISDDCSIIDSGTMSKMFQPFNTNKTTHIGLSLSSSYQIVMAHEGNIEISPIEDKGYKYIISIPL